MTNQSFNRKHRLAKTTRSSNKENIKYRLSNCASGFSLDRYWNAAYALCMYEWHWDSIFRFGCRSKCAKCKMLKLVQKKTQQIAFEQKMLSSETVSARSPWIIGTLNSSSIATTIYARKSTTSSFLSISQFAFHPATIQISVRNQTECTYIVHIYTLHNHHIYIGNLIDNTDIPYSSQHNKSIYLCVYSLSLTTMNRFKTQCSHHTIHMNAIK